MRIGFFAEEVNLPYCIEPHMKRHPRKHRIKDQNPRIITARFDSKCYETGTWILQHELCLYDPSIKRVFNLDSSFATQYRLSQSK